MILLSRCRTAVCDGNHLKVRTRITENMIEGINCRLTKGLKRKRMTNDTKKPKVVRAINRDPAAN
jgi:hypothetical protein